MYTIYIFIRTSCTVAGTHSERRRTEGRRRRETRVGDPAVAATHVRIAVTARARPSLSPTLPIILAVRRRPSQSR